MALSLATPILAGFAPNLAPHVPTTVRSSPSVTMETQADLEVLAKELNPTIGFWDPLGLSGADLWGMGNEATIGWLRHAEIKHGRVAMAAFVGYILQSNGLTMHLQLTTSGTTYEDIAAAGAPPDQWDALPTMGKVQIILAVGLLEFLGESSTSLGNSGMKHYMKGGTPGAYPSLKTTGIVPHPVPLDLWDPFGLTSKMTPEKKAKSLKAEINNGRLAMIGIMGFACASKGVNVGPGLSFIPPYEGEYMAPFAAGDSSLPFVSDMLTAFSDANFAGY